MKEKSSKFALSLENIKFIPFEKYEKYFTFIVDGNRHETSWILADLLSPIVNKYHYEDETINEITIKTGINDIGQKEKENSQHYFLDFLSLANYEEQEIDDIHKRFYSEYFLQLGNIDEYLRLQPEYFESITTENIVDRLKYIYSLPNEIKQNELLNTLTKFASSNFEQITKENLKTLNYEIIEEIIKNPALKLKDEDSLLEFIIDLYRTDFSYSTLFEYVAFKNVSEKVLEKFLSEFNIEHLNSKIWEKICQRLLIQGENNVKEERYEKEKEKRKIIQKDHQSGNEFNGLLRYLSDKTKGNIHDNGTINITSNSISGNCHPKNLVDYQNNESNWYRSEEKTTDAYVCFDFKNLRVQPTSYSIKSFSCSQNDWHLKSWVIEASNDGEQWTKIDEHRNDQTLNGNRIIGTFNIQQKQQFYHFIRLRQTDKNWTNSNYVMKFYLIEFYGKLEELDSSSI